MDHETPIILIGTHRSGTTWLGDVFSRHPSIAYWVEPRHVWTWGHAYRPDDVLGPDDATPRIKKHIRSVFDRYVSEQGANRLMEKTPSNCLRVPFVREVYPEAKLLFVVRDGRSVLRSTGEILRGGVPIRRIIQRARQTSLFEWPAYGEQALSAVWRKVTRQPVRYWGPRPPGWKDWLALDPPDVILAKQWSATVTAAAREGAKIDADHFLLFRYEDLLRQPREVFGRIVSFLELPDADDLIEYVAKTADPTRAEPWREKLDEETLDLVRPYMEPALKELGYAW